MDRFRGLTWDHPRGTDALREAARRAREKGEIDICWEAQPLEGFEARPIAELATRYDLIVMDHPHLGDARADDCLKPLGPTFGSLLEHWQSDTVGASFESYSDRDGQWALPLDAATQVMIRGARVDTPPQTLEELFSASKSLRTVPCYAGPHAALMFMALCAGLGTPCNTGRSERFAEPSTALEALDVMARLAHRMEPRQWDLNPIDMHEAVAAGNVDLCPWVYGYAPYGRPGPGQVRFSDVVRLHPDGVLGSTLGGTGLAVTRKATITPALIDHIKWLMSMESQKGLIPVHSGQPSRKPAWEDEEVNQAVGGFYNDTRRTTEAAWVRPRWPGYTAFQATLSDIIRTGLRNRDTASTVYARWEGVYQSAIGVPA